MFFYKKTKKNIKKMLMSVFSRAWAGLALPASGSRKKIGMNQKRALCGPANLAEMGPARSGFG